MVKNEKHQSLMGKKITISFNFTDEQHSEIEEESKSMSMTSGEMLTNVMKFIVQDLLKTRKSRIHKTEDELPE